MCLSVSDSDEMKKRMYSCIVVVGGGLMFPGAQSWLQYLVWTSMPAQMRLALDTMDVISKQKVRHAPPFIISLGLVGGQRRGQNILIGGCSTESCASL